MPFRDPPGRKFTTSADVHIESWLGQLESWFLREGIVADDQKALFIRDYLDPKLWLDVKSYQNLGYIDLKKQLISLYGNPESSATYYRYYKFLQQKPQESPKEFMDRTRLVVHRARPYMSGTVLEMEVVKKFLEGSKDKHFRKWAEGKFASRKLDVAGALEQACSSELSAGCDPLQSEKMNDPKSSTMQTEPVSVREVSQMAVPSLMSVQKPQSDSTVNAVMLGGYRARFTPQYRTGNTRPTCYTCGKPGHRKAQCWQNRGNYQQFPRNNGFSQNWRSQPAGRSEDGKQPNGVEKSTVATVVLSETPQNSLSEDQLNENRTGSATSSQSAQ